MTECDGGAVPLPNVDEYLAHMHELVPGWFDDLDAAVFRAVDQAQRSVGVDGDFLEIGAYLGKSAILLGYMLRAHERLVVCDLFTTANLDPRFDSDAEQYGSLSRAAFEANYARFHRTPATVIERSSEELVAEGLERSFRVAHIDGSHRYDIVRQDIDTALNLLVEGGVVIVDDYRTVPHALGVAAAVWKAVTDGQLVPVLATVQKLYGCAPAGAGTLATTLRCWGLEDAPFDGLRQQVAGHDMVVFAPPMGSPTPVTDRPSHESELLQAEDEARVARLRERLALIEGSRTWRLRNRLMRLFGRGHIRKPIARA